jgi:hypothetical protein
MKIGFTLWAGILLAVHCSQPTATYAQTRQYHDTIYTLPDQWADGAIRSDHIRLVRPEGHRKTIKVMAAFEISEAETNLLEWMNAKLEESIDFYDRQSIDSPKADIVNSRERVAERFSFRSSNSQLRIAYLHVGAEYANLLIYETQRSYKQAASVALENEYANTFLPFCRNLKFVSQGAKPLLGHSLPGELEGVYFHDNSQLNHFLSSHSGRVVVFSKSGHFYAGLPRSTSAAGLNFERAFKHQPNKSGNYVIKGNSISFDFANGFSTTVDFETGKDGFMLEKGSQFHKAMPLKNRKPLSGTWENGLNQMYDANEIIRGGIGGIKKIELTSAGTYRATQLYGFKKDDSGSLNDVAGRLKPTNVEDKSSGTYAIKDGVIEFTDSSGNATRLNIVYINDNLVIIGGRRYQSCNKRGLPAFNGQKISTPNGIQ